MKPKILHQQAMELSFKAKQALEFGNQDLAFEFYTQAAELESKVAEFYFDKPELDPTRSILIRSAVYLNLKAGLIEEAQHFIFYGLLNIKDELIRDQLNDALELSISLKSIDAKNASKNYNYITTLRQRSVLYVIEPTNIIFDTAVSMGMVKDFSENYLKSLKAFSSAKFRRIVENVPNILIDNIELADDQFQLSINPLIVDAAFGSFKFSIANDFLQRPGDIGELVKLRADIVKKYHEEIFTNPLSDNEINKIKEAYTEEEVNQIFRPVTKIKSSNSPFKVSYFDKESLKKVSIGRIVNDQRKKLLPIRSISKENIGFLESTIIHKRSAEDGKITRNTLFKEQLKSFEYDIRTKYIEPRECSPLLLNEDIIVNFSFDSEIGFSFSFDDLKIEYIATEYHKGLNGFYTDFYNKIIQLASLDELDIEESRDWEIIKKLINNPESLKRK